MHANWKTWTHVTKLDPDKRLPGGAIEEIATSGTDALMLSGTQNVTRDNLLELLDQVSPYGLPVVVEPASPDCAIFDGGIDHLFVPSVLNTNDVRWIVGKHYTWLLNNGDGINWDMVVPEAYIVLNPDSAVGRVTGADCNLSAMEREIRGSADRAGGGRCDQGCPPLLRWGNTFGRTGSGDGPVRRHDRCRKRGLRGRDRGAPGDRPGGALKRDYARNLYSSGRTPL